MQEEIKFHSQHQQESGQEIDIRELLFKFLAKWYWFILSAITLSGVGYLYLKTQAPIYESSASVLIKQEQNAPEEMLLLQDLGLTAGKNNIDNEIGVFKSPDLITKVVSQLEIYTSYRYDSPFKLHNPLLYKESPLYVRWEDVEPDKIPATVNMTFTPSQEGVFQVKATYLLNGEEIIIESTVDSLPRYIDLEIGRFYVARQAAIPFGNKPLLVTIQNAAVAAREIINNLSISPSTKQSSLLNMTLKMENRHKGEDVLNAIINEYNRDAISDKNMVAYNTAVFIEERLKDIAKELGEVEVEVESFRKANQVTDIPTQVGAYLSRNEGYEQKRMEIETQKNLISYIETFISQSDNRNKLIPNLGITDPGLTQVIQSYNDLLIQRERIESSTSASNPAFKQIEQQVRSMHQNITASLANERRASEIALRDLDREYTATNSKILNIPTVSRQYNDILRQQEVKSNLFVYLLQKREETNLTQAGVAPKAKTIARPYSSGSPVAPRRTMILAAFLLLGLVIPAAAIYLLDIFRTKIEGMRDLTKLRGASVIGDIEKVPNMVKGDSQMVVKMDDDSATSEMFRTLRNNLLFMVGERGQNVIMVTSTVPKEGKTFITANLAKSLALMDKRVIVLGCDLRNPQILTAMGYRQWEKGISSYLAGHEEDIDSLIINIDDNLDLIAAGPIPPNPNELLSKNRTGKLIDELKKRYDYVIIDSAPMGLVTDSFLLTKYVDATLYVMREGFTQKDSILFINNLIADKRIKNTAVVLNQATVGGLTGRYRYGYKYSYAYRYRYGYTKEY